MRQKVSLSRQFTYTYAWSSATVSWPKGDELTDVEGLMPSRVLDGSTLLLQDGWHARCLSLSSGYVHAVHLCWPDLAGKRVVCLNSEDALVNRSNSCTLSLSS